MKKFFSKKQENEDEEVIELTPEEKKAKVKKTIVGVAKTIGTMAIGAGLTMAALIGIGAKTADDSEESMDDVVENSCEVETSDNTPEE